MKKCNNSSGDEEYSGEPPNFERKFFAGPPSKTCVKSLSEQELNQLVEERHSALGDG